MSKKKQKEEQDTANTATKQEAIFELTSNSCPIPSGVLVIIGGAEDKGKAIQEGDPKLKLADYMQIEIIRAFCDAMEKENPRIEIITTASSQPDEVEKDYKGVFRKLGCTNIGFIHDFDRIGGVHSPYIDRLKATDGVYFTGGDQLKLTSIYGGTEFLAVLKHRYVYDKLVIAGTSAGAMAMSTPMIYESDNDGDMLKGEVSITTGLEFMKDVAIDTHFVHRGRFVRLAQVIATNPTSIAVGIEEDTAIMVKNGIELTVVGNGAVLILDGHACTHTNIFEVKKDQAVSVQNLMVHILVKGDRYMIPRYNLQHM